MLLCQEHLKVRDRGREGWLEEGGTDGQREKGRKDGWMDERRKGMRE